MCLSNFLSADGEEAEQRIIQSLKEKNHRSFYV